MPFKEESEEEKDSPRDYLLITCLVIAALELIQSLTFAFHTIYDLSLHQNPFNIMVYLGGVLYVLTVKALIVGLWKGLPKLLLFWLIFCGLGAVISIILLIWNVAASPVHDKDHLNKWFIVYLGIFYKCTCLYLVYRYYRKLCPYSLLEGENYDCFEKVCSDKEPETECEDDWKGSLKSLT